MLLQTVAAVLIPAKFADAATRDDGAHKDRVSSDEGLRFELDAKADAALAQSEVYVQVAQAQRSASDVVEDAVKSLSARGVDVGALLQAGALGNVVNTMIQNGEIQGVGSAEAGGVDVEDVIEGLDASDIQEITADS